ncbi:hypothetical protein B566_EDAN008704 [Ephemera danica]|nr:hypothetical protein B566_EDAN008704 [Ephemera danica]
MAGRLSAQDRQDLEKYTKFLAIKATQIIVQSRLGDKVATKSKPHSSGTDWFNLAIPDLPEVTAQARAVLGGQVPSARLPLCVEISLRTSEGDGMVLETWTLAALEPPDHTARVTHTVYNRMGLLLKSLIAVTRVTPAYKLSRRQSADSYLICYRIYSGEPQLHVLGEGQSLVRVGHLSTPLGTLQLSVAYRTKMTISPQHTSQPRDIMVKSDHFHPDLSPKHHTRFQLSDDNTTSLSETIKPGAFADLGHKPAVPLLLPEEREVPFGSLLAPPIHNSPPPPPSVCPASPQLDNNRNNTEAALQKLQQDNNANNARSSPPNSRRSSCSAMSGAADDFIMVDLKTPFAGGTNANSDLGAFYRECQAAPPLKTFSEQPSLAEQVSALPSQLEHFEQSQAEFDAILSSLLQSQTSLT